MIENEEGKLRISETDLHLHLRARMRQRGVTVLLTVKARYGKDFPRR